MGKRFSLYEIEVVYGIQLISCAPIARRESSKCTSVYIPDRELPIVSRSL